jgi:hypothetical protein
MKELDETLIRFFKEKSDNIGDKDYVKASEVNGITKVAFDMFKIANDHYDCLWKLEKVDGVDYLIRNSDPKYNYSDHGEWKIASDYENKNVTLSYKNTPIERFSSDEFGFQPDSIGVFKTALHDKLSDENFVRDMLTDQPSDKFSAITATYPELKKYFK